MNESKMDVFLNDDLTLTLYGYTDEIEDIYMAILPALKRYAKQQDAMPITESLLEENKNEDI
mgnify:FL=1